MGHQQLILEDKEGEAGKPTTQVRPAVSCLESVEDADLDSTSGSDCGLVVDNPPFYKRFWGLMMEK